MIATRLLRFASIFVLLSRILFVMSVPRYTLVLGGVPALWTGANFLCASLLILVSLTLIVVHSAQPARQFDLATWSALPLCVLLDICTGYPLHALFSPFQD